MHQIAFWKFFVGQGLAALGSSFTSFALPLLIFQLTGSPTSLALSFAFGMLPFLLFGLVGGAWSDRSDRKRFMIRTDLLRGAILVSISILYYLDALAIWWIYANGFVVTLVGACLVELTNVVLVYAISGTLATLIPLVFFFSPLGHAEEYLRVDASAETGPAATQV